MTKSKPNLAQLANKIYDILEPLEQDVRQRTIQAVQLLFGEVGVGQPDSDNANSNAGQGQGASFKTINEKAFFDSKQPENKMEELAVAARYRELHEGKNVHTKDELKKVIVSSRRNFDNRNFARDMNNAKGKGLFNKGTARGSDVLAYYGQHYVDALPDREAVKKIKKPKGTNRSKPKKKPKAKSRK